MQSPGHQLTSGHEAHHEFQLEEGEGVTYGWNGEQVHAQQRKECNGEGGIEYGIWCTAGNKEEACLSLLFSSIRERGSGGPDADDMCTSTLKASLTAFPVILVHF